MVVQYFLSSGLFHLKAKGVTSQKETNLKKGMHIGRTSIRFTERHALGTFNRKAGLLIGSTAPRLSQWKPWKNAP